MERFHRAIFPQKKEKLFIDIWAAQATIQATTILHKIQKKEIFQLKKMQIFQI